MTEDLFASLSVDGFGYWLAGLTDGEGCFSIVPNRPGFICRFNIGLREDDGPMLSVIGERTGLGRFMSHRRAFGANRKPLAHWRVERKADCQALVEIFDAFPLRSKKARDYAIWRDAVAVMAEMTGTVAVGRPRDWSQVRRLKQELADVRLYRKPIWDAALANRAKAGDRA